MEYCGAGYFRLPGPVGKERPILHGPQIVERLLTIIDAQNNSADPQNIGT